MTVSFLHLVLFLNEAGSLRVLQLLIRPFSICTTAACFICCVRVCTSLLISYALVYSLKCGCFPKCSNGRLLLLSCILWFLPSHWTLACFTSNWWEPWSFSLYRLIFTVLPFSLFRLLFVLLFLQSFFQFLIVFDETLKHCLHASCFNIGIILSINFELEVLLECFIVFFTVVFLEKIHDKGP